MDEGSIGLVLAKTSELRSKIVNSIATSNVEKRREESDVKEYGDNGERFNEEEAESLLNIKDALESIESQLSSLQALQQQQWYEKESALAEIELSQKKLLKELKEYKGKDLKVIHEAIAFASETKDNSDLLLPPYPGQPHHSTISNNGYASSFPSENKFAQNGETNDNFKYLPQPERNEIQCRQNGPLKRLKFWIGAAAKTALTVVGVLAILNLAGFKPRLRKQDKLLDLLGLHSNDEKGAAPIQCPPGKVLVVENGEVGCVVKERISIAFESAVATPDVSYGCG